MKKTFVVTGASRGIGFDLVKHIAAKGHTVFALSRNLKSLQTEEMIHPVSLDITDEKALENFAKKLRADNIVIDALINNAEIGIPLFSRSEVSFAFKPRS